MPTIFRARWVLPIDADAIENGEIRVDNGLITDVGPSRSTDTTGTRDFGNAILMPGFVNAHTHLEYTALRGVLDDLPFFNWIRSLVAIKQPLTLDDWRGSALLGAAECLASGTTTVGDNSDSGTTAPVLAQAGLRGIVFQEVFGVDPAESVPDIISRLRHRLDDLSEYCSPTITLGISPHSPYTVRRELFTALSMLDWPEAQRMSIHLAESAEEDALIRNGEGPFAEMLQRRGIPWEAFSGATAAASGPSPTRYLADTGLLRKGTLAVHCVQQSENDINILADSGASVVHCPKSNAKLAAGVAPLARWLATPGLTVALGTDSAVSNNTLDMFEEMRFGLLTQRAATRDVTSVTARQLVEMATLGGAKALGLDDKIGTLTPGKRADIIAITLDSLRAAPSTDPYSALVYACSTNNVLFSMVDGEVVYESGRCARLDHDRILHNAMSVREKAEAAR